MITLQIQIYYNKSNLNNIKKDIIEVMEDIQKYNTGIFYDFEIIGFKSDKNIGRIDCFWRVPVNETCDWAEHGMNDASMESEIESRITKII
jgi:hypothetical protein